MKIVKQLAIFLENQPGALFRLTQDFLAQNISIKALSVTDSLDHAVVRLVVDKPQEALHLLGDAGVLVVESDLLEISLENIPGQLGLLCKKLGELGFNIEYAYGSTVPECNKGNLYIRVIDTQKVLQAFNNGKL